MSRKKDEFSFLTKKTEELINLIKIPMDGTDPKHLKQFLFSVYYAGKMDGLQVASLIWKGGEKK